MTLPYNPTTDYGAGFLPLLNRATGHALFVIGARLHDWPMTTEQAHAELTEAINHINALQVNAGLLSTAGREAIENWKTTLQGLVNELAPHVNTNPDARLMADMVTYAQQTYALLAILDTELLDLAPPHTDAGRLP